MFGYLIADKSRLDNVQTARYRECYCGLCRVLKQQHGQVSRLCLTYDMTFLVMLLDSLYEPDIEAGKNRCPVHPAHPQLWRTSRWTEYCADLNVVLAYFNCLDDWEDDRELSKLTYAGALHRAYCRVKEQQPDSCAAIEQALYRLSGLEEIHSSDLDGASRCFGSLMGSLFAVGDPFWHDTLYTVGDYLGRFIYVMDAVLDETSDQRCGRYNPVTAFRAEYGPLDEGQTLTLLIGSCVSAYETLPLVQDKDLLDNVLYHGVWAKWAAAKQKKANGKARQEESHNDR